MLDPLLGARFACPCSSAGRVWFLLIAVTASLSWEPRLLLCSLNTITKETAMMARELGRSSPDPRLGSMVELSRGNASGLLDLIRVGKALPGQGIAAEEPPPALLQVEKACSCRNEDVVEPWMLF